MVFLCGFWLFIKAGGGKDEKRGDGDELSACMHTYTCRGINLYHSWALWASLHHRANDPDPDPDPDEIVSALVLVL